MERFYRLAYDFINSDEEGELKLIDKWMQSRLQFRIKETMQALNMMQTRRAVQNAFYLLMNDMKWYERRGGRAARKQILNTWVRLMAPFIPHICEEIGEESGMDMVSLARFPQVDPTLIDKGAELAEETTANTLHDMEEIIRLIKIKPKRIILYTSAAWKNQVLKRALEMKKENALDMKMLMNTLMSDPAMRAYGKDIPKFAQKTITDIQGMEQDLMDALLAVDFDDISALNEAREFLSCAVGCSIEIYSSDAPGYDPQGKSRFASPMRPAIYIE
jgi:leucyl-tRNA synthetase